MSKEHTKLKAEEYRTAIDRVKDAHPEAVCNIIQKAYTVFYVVRWRPRGKVVASSTSVYGAWMAAARMLDE